VPPEPATLRAVSRTSGGEHYTALDAEGLERVHEKLKSRLGTRKEDREVTDAFAAGAAGLLLAGGALSALWFRRLP
jgi:Ca-activated chloride channel family protein